MSFFYEVFSARKNAVVRRRTICALLFAALTVLPVCAAPAADLSRIVVVGDSLAAGFQNFSLFSGVPFGGQEQGYTALVAKQANATVPQALISYPGIPPALELTAAGIVRAVGAPGMRVNPGVQPLNLAVPGFTLANTLTYPFPGNPQANAIDAMSDSVLGYPSNVPGCGPIPTGSSYIVSQVTCAVGLRPTAILVSAGNNDALGALTFGTPPTDSRIFAFQFRALMTALAATRASVIVSNIPDVTTTPFLLPVPAFQAACPASRLPAGTSPADFVVPDITSPSGDFNVCTTFAVRSAALIASAQAAVAAYNNTIATEASRVGAVVVDVHGLMAKVAAQGYQVFPNKPPLTTAFLGGLFSLDGIHPSNSGYAILANEVIDTMNKKLKTNLQRVDVLQIALADPLVPEPLKH